MKKSILFLAASVFTLTACTKSVELTDAQVEETINNVYKLRAEDNHEELAKLIEGALPEQVNGIENQILEATKVYGPVNKYDLEKITPLVYADENVYEAVYNVQFENGKGTETFKVKSVANQPTVVGYSFSISEDATAPVQDSTATTTEVAPAQDSIK